MAVATISNTNSYSTTVLEAGKQCVNWCGRQISTGWKEYLYPFFSTILSVARQGYGVAFIFAVLGYKAIKVAANPNEGDRRVIVAAYTAAAACFIIAGYALALGSGRFI